VQKIELPDIPSDLKTEADLKSPIFTVQFSLLCLSSFLFFGSFNILLPELPGYLAQLGGEDYKGLIISLFTLTAGLSRPFSGKLTDTIGRVPIMIYGVVVCVIAGILYPILTSVAGFLFLRFIHGMSTGFKPTATSAYVADVIHHSRRGEAMGLVGLFGSLGMASGPVIGSWITLNYGINTLFYISSIMALLSALVLLGMKETLPNPQRFHFKQLGISRHEIMEPLVIVPSIVMLMTVFPYGAVVTIAPDMSEFLGIPNKGWFFSFFTVASIAVRVVAGKASDRLGRVPVIKLSLIILTIAMIVMSFAHTQVLFFTAAVLFGLGVGMGNPTLFAWTIDLSDERYRGRAMATLYIALELGIGSGAVVCSMIYHNDPTRLVYAFWLCALVVFLGFIYLLVYGNRAQAQAVLKNN
jgi:MFS family permease